MAEKSRLRERLGESPEDGGKESLTICSRLKWAEGKGER